MQVETIFRHQSGIRLALIRLINAKFQKTSKFRVILSLEINLIMINTNLISLLN